METKKQKKKWYLQLDKEWADKMDIFIRMYAGSRTFAVTQALELWKREMLIKWGHNPDE